MAATINDFASYWREIDYHIKYFDVSGLPASQDLSPAVNIWIPRVAQKWLNFALEPSGSPQQQQAEQALRTSLGDAQIASAVQAIDGLLIGLVDKYFLNNGALDTASLWSCHELFGRDQLPPDQDRLNRITALNDPNDFRLQFAGRHSMDSPQMWFYLAGFVETALMLNGADRDLPKRVALLGGAMIGSTMDFVFRRRSKTRPEYYPQPSGRDAVWAKARSLENDRAGMVDELHALAQIALQHSANLFAGGRHQLDSTPAVPIPSVKDVVAYLEKVGAHATFAPHGKFWDTDYMSFFNGFVTGSGTDCNGQSTPILDHAQLENSPLLQALEKSDGCGRECDVERFDRVLHAGERCELL